MGIKLVRSVLDDKTGKPLDEDSATVVRLVCQIMRKPGQTEDQEPEAPVTWELYFAEDSHTAFTADLGKYTKYAEAVASAPAQTPVRRRSKDGPDPINMGIRAWWRQLTVGQRVDLGDLPKPPEQPKGRIPDAVQAAWEQLPEADRSGWVLRAKEAMEAAS